MTNTEIKTKNPPKKKAANIQVDKLRTFEGHPFKVLDDEDMGNLIESIRQQGIISPLIVRAIESTDEYEVISGHRRLHAAVKAGLSEVPALIYPLDRNEAVIAVVDSNLHRERLLPSEKAFAYKMKMEALKQQGRRTDLTLSQLRAVDNPPNFVNVTRYHDKNLAKIAEIFQRKRSWFPMPWPLSSF